MSNNGAKKLEDLGGTIGVMMKELEKVSPDIVKYAINHVCGDIYIRPGLDVKSREMIAISALIVANNMFHVKVHIEAALNIGVSPEEIKEIIIQTSVYGGWAASLNAMMVAKEVFESRGII